MGYIEAQRSIGLPATPPLVVEVVVLMLPWSRLEEEHIGNMFSPDNAAAVALEEDPMDRPPDSDAAERAIDVSRWRTVELSTDVQGKNSTG